MSRNISNTKAVTVPAALHPSTLRAGLALAVVAALAAFVMRLAFGYSPPSSSCFAFLVF